MHPPTESLVLLLSSDDPAHTTLTATSTNTVLYHTETDFCSNKHPVTTLHNHNGQVIASLERHEVLSDMVTILGDKFPSQPMKLTKWMKPGLVKRSTCMFEDQHGHQFEWRGYAVGKVLQLCAADTPSHPIAYFTRRIPRLALSTSHATSSSTLSPTPSYSSTAESLPLFPSSSTLTLLPRARAFVKMSSTCQWAPVRMGNQAWR